MLLFAFLRFTAVRALHAEKAHCMQVIRAALSDSRVEASQWQSVEMHGTGTALGDPIEIGAAFAVAAAAGAGDAVLGVVGLLDGVSIDKVRWCCIATGVRVSLTAAKSRVGHAETAAGAIGIVHAVHSLSSCVVAPMLHLAAFNPYVSGILEAAGREGSSTACIPRQVSMQAAACSAPVLIRMCLL